MANMSSLLGTEEDPNDFLASVLAAGKSAPPMSSEALTPLQMVMYPQDTTPMNELIPNLIKSKQGVTVTSAPRAMISRDDNEELNKRTTPALDRQKTSLEALKDQIEAYEKKDTSVNPLVAAVMGASDIFGRTNYVKDQLMPMKQAEAQREMNVLGLKKDYQKQVSDLTKEDLAFKRQQYQDAQNQSRESRILNLEQQKLDLLKGKTKDEPELKDWQVKDANYGKRMLQAEDVLKSLQSSGFDPTKKEEGFRSTVQRGPFEYFKDENLKSYEQAKRNFINSVLRDESGATITPDEFATAEKQYFPQVNDPPASVEQKRRNRQQVIESMKVGAGRAWDKIVTVPGVGGSSTEGQTKEYNGATYKMQGDHWVKVK